MPNVHQAINRQDCIQRARAVVETALSQEPGISGNHRITVQRKLRAHIQKSVVASCENPIFCLDEVSELKTKHMTMKSKSKRKRYYSWTHFDGGEVMVRQNFHKLFLMHACSKDYFHLVSFNERSKLLSAEELKQVRDALNKSFGDNSARFDG